MRVRVAALIIAILTTLSVSVAAPARADTGSLGAGSADLFSPSSIFLWQSPPTRYIVVLGAKMGTFGQTPAILAQRMNVAANLALSHPFNRMIVSGGNTWWLPVSEAQFMNVGLLRRGVPVWQMINEAASTSTVANATNTVAMLKHMGATGALIVTNGFHMGRALNDFRTAARKQHARLEFRPAYA